MKTKLIALLLCITATSIWGKFTNYEIRTVDKGLYFVYFDTSAIKHTVSKAAIVEFKDFVVLLEMPIAYRNTGLTDHKTEGTELLTAIKQKFPKKPLKYMVSSHWHPHSISSVLPLLENGTTIYTTSSNFLKFGQILDTAVARKYMKSFRFVDKDTVEIKDKTNQLIAYRLRQTEFSYLPTDDFLFTYLPKYQCLQTSCMYQRLPGAKSRGKEMVSGRTDQLNAFINNRNLAVKRLLCTEITDDNDSGFIAMDTLNAVVKNGTGMAMMENELLAIPEIIWQTQFDSLSETIMNNGTFPLSVITKAVYTALGKNKIVTALHIAKLAALLNPSDPNSWDTYGEVYYFMGEQKIAKRYELQSKKIDKNFNGGEESWKKDLEDFEKKWRNSKQ